MLSVGWLALPMLLALTCSATAETSVTACTLAKSPVATLYTEGFNRFVTSSVAPIATGWSDQLPGGNRTH